MAPSEFLPICEGTDVENKGLVPFKVIFFKVDLGGSEVLPIRTIGPHLYTYVKSCHVKTWNFFYTMTRPNPNTSVFLLNPCPG